MSLGTTSPATAPLARPLYRHIKVFVREHVESGAWPPGHRVPSENELVSQFNVSRMTAHRALRELQQEGVLARRPGVGTFVREPSRRTSLIDIRNIADEITARGNRHSCSVELKATIIATDQLATAFDLDRGTELFHVVLVHRERTGHDKAVPVQLENRYVNAKVVSDFLEHDFKSSTPTALLLAAIQPDEIEHTVTAIRPTKEHQRLLEVKSGEPCLSLHRRSWSGEHVVTVAELIYPASRYSLHGRHRPANV